MCLTYKASKACGLAACQLLLRPVRKHFADQFPLTGNAIWSFIFKSCFWSETTESFLTALFNIGLHVSIILDYSCIFSYVFISKKAFSSINVSIYIEKNATRQMARRGIVQNRTFWLVRLCPGSKTMKII